MRANKRKKGNQETKKKVKPFLDQFRIGVENNWFLYRSFNFFCVASKSSKTVLVHILG